MQGIGIREQGIENQGTEKAVSMMGNKVRKLRLQTVTEGEPGQRLLDIAAYESADEGILQGLDDVAHGRTTPAKEVFDRIRSKYNIPR